MDIRKISDIVDVGTKDYRVIWLTYQDFLHGAGDCIKQLRV